MDIWNTEHQTDTKGLIQDNNNDVHKGGNNSVKDMGDVPDKTYKRRWYILIIFALMCGTQGGVWSTWGPISTSAKYAFGWSDHTVGFLTNWGPITYIIGAPFFTWLIDVKGLRWATLITAGLITFGTGLRCITSDPTPMLYLTHTGWKIMFS